MSDRGRASWLTADVRQAKSAVDDFDVFRVDFDADVAASGISRSKTGRAAPRKWVEHHVAFVAP